MSDMAVQSTQSPAVDGITSAKKDQAPLNDPLADPLADPLSKSPNKLVGTSPNNPPAKSSGNPATKSPDNPSTKSLDKSSANPIAQPLPKIKSIRYSLAAGLRVRGGPTPTDTILGNLEQGAKVYVTGSEKGGWLEHVYLGKVGWTAGAYLDSNPPKKKSKDISQKPDETSAGPQSKWTISSTNKQATGNLGAPLYAEPGATGIALRYFLGQTVTVVEELTQKGSSEKWAKVKWIGSGYTKMENLSFGGEADKEKEKKSTTPAESAEDAKLASKLGAWGLAPEALKGTLSLMKQAPGVIIKSGRRSRSVEAWAWAPNIAKKQRWMEILIAFKNRADLQAVQLWIDENWKEGEQVAGKSAPIAAKLLETFNKISDSGMASISPHYLGLGLDIGMTNLVSEGMLLSLPNIKQVLNETNHWHLGFKVADAGAKQPGSGM